MSTENRVAGPARLPSAPDEYDPAFFNRMIGLIDQYVAQGNARRRVLGTTANLSNLPTSATGLRAGDLWNDGGVVKIIT